jgi:hypothetical protein
MKQLIWADKVLSDVCAFLLLHYYLISLVKVHHEIISLSGESFDSLERSSKLVLAPMFVDFSLYIQVHIDFVF